MQYKWMYPFKRLEIICILNNHLYLKKNIWLFNLYLLLCRYLFNLKNRVKNKMHVEASICEAYIIEEISTYILYYSKSHLRTRINRIPRYDIDGEMSSSENLSIFFYLGWWLSKNAITRRYLSNIEFR
jgi:hypothetical protein